MMLVLSCVSCRFLLASSFIWPLSTCSQANSCFRASRSWMAACSCLFYYSRVRIVQSSLGNDYAGSGCWVSSTCRRVLRSRISVYFWNKMSIENYYTPPRGPKLKQSAPGICQRDAQGLKHGCSGLNCCKIGKQQNEAVSKLEKLSRIITGSGARRAVHSDSLEEQALGRVVGQHNKGGAQLTLDMVEFEEGEGVVRDAEEERPQQNQHVAGVVLLPQAGRDRHHREHQSVDEEEGQVGGFVPQLRYVEHQQGQDEGDEQHEDPNAGPFELGQLPPRDVVQESPDVQHMGDHEAEGADLEHDCVADHQAQVAPQAEDQAQHEDLLLAGPGLAEQDEQNDGQGLEQDQVVVVDQVAHDLEHRQQHQKMETPVSLLEGGRGLRLHCLLDCFSQFHQIILIIEQAPGGLNQGMRFSCWVLEHLPSRGSDAGRACSGVLGARRGQNGQNCRPRLLEQIYQATLGRPDTQAFDHIYQISFAIFRAACLHIMGWPQLQLSLLFFILNTDEQFLCQEQYTRIHDHLASPSFDSSRQSSLFRSSTSSCLVAPSRSTARLRSSRRRSQPCFSASKYSRSLILVSYSNLTSSQLTLWMQVLSRQSRTYWLAANLRPSSISPSSSYFLFLSRSASRSLSTATPTPTPASPCMSISALSFSILAC